MPRKKTPDQRLTQALARESKLKETNSVQQAELEQLREVVGQLTAAKPGRAFRSRTLLHGGLDVKLKGSDLAESEVWIEHRGEVLIVLVGQAAQAAYGGAFNIQHSTLNTQHAKSREFTPEYVETAPSELLRRSQLDLQELELQRVGLDATSLGANVSLFGQPLANVFTDDGRPVVNAAVAPQADPRRPGGWQDRTEAAEIAQHYGGYDGRGPKPAGWVDPDTQPS